MVFFEDFGKTVRDLFKKEDYEANGVTLTCTTEDATFSTECLFPGGNKFIVAHKSYGKAEFGERNKLGKRLKYTFPSLLDRFNMKFEASKSEGGLSVEYAEGEIAAKCKAELGNNFSLTCEVAKEVEGLWVGGELKFNSTDGLEQYKAGMHYENDDTKLSFKTDFDELHVKLWKRYCSKGSISANYDLDLNREEALVSVGGIWDLDEQCWIQGFLQTDGNTYLLYKHKLSDRLSAGVGTSFILHNILNEINVSYKLEFEA